MHLWPAKKACGQHVVYAACYHCDKRHRVLNSLLPAHTHTTNQNRVPFYCCTHTLTHMHTHRSRLGLWLFGPYPPPADPGAV